MSELPAGPAVGGEGARERILAAAIRCIAREGVEGASMSAIASHAEVSKGLLHYHYEDRGHLLAEAVRRLAARITERERQALAEAEPGQAVNSLWTLMAGELERGELRVLVELGLQRDPAVRAASDGAAAERRARAASSVAPLFTSLSLTPRVPAPLLAHATVAFVDGLVLDVGHGRRDPRVSFDIFWLALLSLGD
jgi:AcrR family transcriptional regulator